MIDKHLMQMWLNQIELFYMVMRLVCKLLVDCMKLLVVHKLEQLLLVLVYNEHLLHDYF